MSGSMQRQCWSLHRLNVGMVRGFTGPKFSIIDRKAQPLLPVSSLLFLLLHVSC